MEFLRIKEKGSWMLEEGSLWYPYINFHHPASGSQLQHHSAVDNDFCSGHEA
jgi:hypothetical protein